MTSIYLRTWPDPILTQPSGPVTDFGKEFQALVDSMLTLMHLERGVGLAAPQVGVLQRVFVTAFDEYPVFVNPRELSLGEMTSLEEGCLSFPGVWIDGVPRSRDVSGVAQDRRGKEFEFSVSGLLSQCIQHETDHLNGVVMLDHVNRKQRRSIEARILKKS